MLLGLSSRLGSSLRSGRPSFALAVWFSSGGPVRSLSLPAEPDSLPADCPALSFSVADELAAGWLALLLDALAVGPCVELLELFAGGGVLLGGGVVLGGGGLGSDWGCVGLLTLGQPDSIRQRPTVSPTP
jgi:hypothetical protein